jgi:hypothetical protein
MNGVIYTIWAVVIAIGSFRTAATGRWRKGRSKRYWTIPMWCRLVFLFIGIISTAAAIFAAARYFSR